MPQRQKGSLLSTTPAQRRANAARQATYRNRQGKPRNSLADVQSQVLGFLSSGDSIEEAMSKVARGPAAFAKWQTRYPDFAKRYHALRYRLGGGEYPPCPFNEESRKKYFSVDYDEPISPRHLRVAIDFINSLKPGQFGLITLPPEHAKTSLGEDWISCALADDPETRAVIISKTQNDATNRTLKIQARMEDLDFYEEFISTYGPFKPEGRGTRPWAATKMTIVRKTPKQRDYSLQALGIGAQVQGKRIDKALLDDVVDDENYREYESQARYIRQSVNTRLGKTGVALMIGTRQDEMDLYKYLADEGFFDKTLILPAVFEKDYQYTLATGSMMAWQAGEGLWPERYSLADYETMQRKAGPRIWALTYQQQNVVSEGQAFPMDVIESAYDLEYRAQVVPPGHLVSVGVDPAAQGYTAGVVLAINPKTKQRILVDVWNERGLVADGGDRREGVVQFITTLCGLYGTNRLVLEDNSAFTYVSSSPQMRAALHDMGCALETVRASKFRHHDDAMNLTLSTLFSNGVIKIPVAGTSTQVFREFVQQLNAWRPHDKKQTRDIVRAFYYAEVGAQQMLDRFSGRSSYTQPGVPNFQKRLARVS